MRGRLSVLIVSGVLVTGCTSTGVIGPAGTSAAGQGAAHGPASSSASPTSAPASSPAGTEDAAVVIGTGPTVVTIYDDYRCPACKDAHDRLALPLKSALAGGKIKVEYHAVDLIDRNSGGTGSLLSAGAVSCAFKSGKFEPYRDALFAAQPAESDDAFAQPDKLIQIAKTVDGLDSPAFEGCVRAQPFAGSIRKAYDSAFVHGKIPGTPAVLIAGRQWQLPVSGDVAAAFTEALNKAG